jgi:hypothetical protein
MYFHAEAFNHKISSAVPSSCNKEYAPYVRFVRSIFKVGTDNLTTFHPCYRGRPGMAVGCCMAMA